MEHHFNNAYNNKSPLIHSCFFVVEIGPGKAEEDGWVDGFVHLCSFYCFCNKTDII